MDDLAAQCTSRMRDSTTRIVSLRTPTASRNSVRNNGLVLLTLCDLLVQSFTQLGSHAKVVNLLRLRLRGAADHNLTRGGCTAELH
eukprot:5996560-Pleurochrysis_carterae.AAC.1